MNVYEDVQRRVHFMLNEIGRLGHDYHQYHLVVSRKLYAELVRDMDETTRAGHRFKPAQLLGFPLHLDDGRREYYLALVHEVQG